MNRTTYEQLQREISKVERELQGLLDAATATANLADETGIVTDEILRAVELVRECAESVSPLLLTARQICQDIIAGNMNVGD